MNDAVPNSFRKPGENRRDLEARQRRRRAWTYVRVFGVMLIALAVFGLFPHFTMSVVVTALLAMFCLAWWSDRRQRRIHDADEKHLAACPCPSCSKPFGSEVAYFARTGEFVRRGLKKDGLSENIVFMDMFGNWGVDCAHCTSKFLYHPNTREFIPLAPEPAQLARAALNREWDEILDWLREEDIKLPECDAPIGHYLATEHLNADLLPELRAHEERLKQEVSHLVGNGTYYKLRCLRIIAALQVHCSTSTRA